MEGEARCEPPSEILLRLERHDGPGGHELGQHESGIAIACANIEHGLAPLDYLQYTRCASTAQSPSSFCSWCLRFSSMVKPCPRPARIILGWAMFSKYGLLFSLKAASWNESFPRGEKRWSRCLEQKPVSAAESGPVVLG